MSIILSGRFWCSSSSTAERFCHAHTIHEAQKKGEAKEGGVLRRSGWGAQKPEKQTVEFYRENSGPSAKSDGLRTGK